MNEAIYRYIFIYIKETPLSDIKIHIGCGDVGNRGL